LLLADEQFRGKALTNLNGISTALNQRTEDLAAATNLIQDAFDLKRCPDKRRQILDEITRLTED
jgi:hypothetical protein